MTISAIAQIQLVLLPSPRKRKNKPKTISQREGFGYSFTDSLINEPANPTTPNPIKNNPQPSHQEYSCPIFSMGANMRKAAQTKIRAQPTVSPLSLGRQSMNLRVFSYSIVLILND